MLGDVKLWCISVSQMEILFYQPTLIVVLVLKVHCDEFEGFKGDMGSVKFVHFPQKHMIVQQKGSLLASS